MTVRQTVHRPGSLDVTSDDHLLPYLAHGGTDGAGGTRSRHGVLLLHGFTGSPASMRPWAEHLHARGWTVSVPVLPGHTTTWQELNTTTWDEWYDEAEHALDDLLTRCDTICVTGLSMGGALALRLAEERDTDVAALALVNPAVASKDVRLRALPLLKRLVPSIPGISNDIAKPGQDERAYSRTPLRALASMQQLWSVTVEDLPKVTAPLLLLRSETDHVVDPSSAALILTRVSSRVRHQTLLHDSYHVATLDHDAPQIFADSDMFFREHTGGGPDA